VIFATVAPLSPDRLKRLAVRLNGRFLTLSDYRTPQGLP
jgi:hypothetical protein